MTIELKEEDIPEEDLNQFLEKLKIDISKGKKNGMLAVQKENYKYVLYYQIENNVPCVYYFKTNDVLKLKA